MKRNISLNLVMIVSVCTIFSCSSPQVLSDQTRSVNQFSAPEVKNDPSLIQSFRRSYQDSLSCLLMEQPFTTTYEREKLSALNGFAVGPESAYFSADLSKPILRPFTSDGCSASPDGMPMTKDSSVWVDCCIRHDTSYWMGGTREAKNTADEELRSCMAEKGYPKMGKMYKVFVSEFGGPRSTQSYRWGYGWNYIRNYSELTEDENTQIKRLYGVDKNNFSDFMMKRSFPLSRVCDPSDPVFNGLSKQENSVYKFLNARLQKQDVITWARLKNFNRDSYSYQVKLLSCAEPVLVIIYEDAKTGTELKSTCDL